ncbi:MAG: cell division protein FtsZ, partial [Deltaproteobacteria bacterium]|nr:cell division protein FtsZ [Deltaproteobacteria bacterium]
GVEELKKVVDTLIVIPNTRLRSLAPKNARFEDMLKKADEVLLYAVRGISDLIITPGLINLDFADVRTVMGEMGVALMGTGEASGDDRALQAATRAINNPLLEDITIDGARGVLVNITASDEITIDEVSEASTFIQEAAHEDANIIWGTVIDKSMGEGMRVTVIATGIGQTEEVQEVRRVAVAGGGGSGREMDISEIDENNVRRYRRSSASLRGLSSPGSREARSVGGDTSDLDWPAFLRRQAD